ncbi:hypothetical protein [Streptomyces sedi]|uniref:Uncharacterized protein n=1 Tax=Streptomyces sedi TaxID=555059 RepID=A0A5C4UZ65_9ACTN|nr:hypothetical protein [Streptomyces sedi]TNM28798.1 hypothetical protein FH715_17355 [Streptomyces sedi]
MSLVRPTDPDFLVSRLGLGALTALQRDAEERGYATRWTSVEALRGQVAESGGILLRTLLREERDGVPHAVRCLVLFSSAGGGGSGGVATLDVHPSRLAALDRLDRDPDVRAALARVFVLATGGISMVTKR